MAEIKLILLDFDGTLVDTRNANAEACDESRAQSEPDVFCGHT